MWSATGPNAFDCSGLVQWSYKEAGIPLARTTYEQAKEGAPVDKHDCNPGDVVLLYGAEHVGLFTGSCTASATPRPPLSGYDPTTAMTDMTDSRRSGAAEPGECRWRTPATRQRRVSRYREWLSPLPVPPCRVCGAAHPGDDGPEVGASHDR